MNAGALLALAVGLPACQDDLPTALDPALAPGFITWEERLEPAEHLEDIGVFRGFIDPRSAPFLVLAREFDGALSANALARFGDLPDSISYSFGGTAVTDTAFSVVGGELIAIVDTLALVAGTAVTLEAWSIAQEWDPSTVTWTHSVDAADDRQPWTSPGGARGELLGRMAWAWTAGGSDTLRLELDGETLAQLMVASSTPDILLTVVDPGSRMEVRRLELRLTVEPEASDTVTSLTVPLVAQRFVASATSALHPWQIGGITGDRHLFRLELPDVLPCPTCPGGTIASDRVMLARAELLFDSQPVPGGFRPMRPVRIVLRELGSPPTGGEGEHLWSLAPLGSDIAWATVDPVQFHIGGEGPVSIVVSAAVRDMQLRGRSIALAAMVEPQGSSFGFARLSPPRLRLIYTIPQQPELP
jgi:hypothetical protein